MVFSSIIFLIFFLPSLLLIYFVLPRRWRGARNFVLLGFSIVFYAWGGVHYLGLLLGSVAVNYVCGLLAGEGHSLRMRKMAAVVAVVIGIGLLGWFKYAGFFAQTINSIGIALPIPNIVLPIGISFFTFQGLSYVIDVSRGDAAAQKNPLNVALYITLFPQLVAGPIVRYTTVADEIQNRRESVGDFSDGLVRFLIGLGKKMVLANAMAEIADAVYQTDIATVSVTLAWIGAIAYTFQIYFDFSAYSDMAIGLGRIFGFHFLENFQYPYIARTVTEFWRRWHISLSSWFRDYVYIPLGGSRCVSWKRVRNIAVVWLLTGLWHGAAWTFILWGAWFCVLLLGEKFLWGKLLDRLPKVVGHCYTMLAVILSWVFFRSESVGGAVRFIGTMFGFGNHSLWSADTVFYLRQYGIYLLLCVIGSLPVKVVLQQFLEARQDRRLDRLALDWMPKLFALGVLLLSYMKLVTGSFNPFIYFQF